jgi:hypothetical protein
MYPERECRGQRSPMASGSKKAAVRHGRSERVAFLVRPEGCEGSGRGPRHPHHLREVLHQGQNNGFQDLVDAGSSARTWVEGKARIEGKE